MKTVLALFIFSVSQSIFSAATYADQTVIRFKCAEKMSALKINGIVTESAKEPWRFLMALESSNGSKAAFESRSGSGFDYDTNESINGYYSYQKGAEDLSYEEISNGRRTNRVLTLTYTSLTGDAKQHTLGCNEVP